MGLHQYYNNESYHLLCTYYQPTVFGTLHVILNPHHKIVSNYFDFTFIDENNK